MQKCSFAFFLRLDCLLALAKNNNQDGLRNYKNLVDFIFLNQIDPKQKQHY